MTNCWIFACQISIPHLRHQQLQSVRWNSPQHGATQSWYKINLQRYELALKFSGRLVQILLFYSQVFFLRRKCVREIAAIIATSNWSLILVRRCRTIVQTRMRLLDWPQLFFQLARSYVVVRRPAQLRQLIYNLFYLPDLTFISLTKLLASRIAWKCNCWKRILEQCWFSTCWATLTTYCPYVF